MSKKIQVTLTDEMWEQLQKEAAASGLKPATWIRYILVEKLGKQQDEVRI